MSSYHTSFSYLNEHSHKDHKLIIAHFDNYDNGETDSYLSVDPIFHDSFDGTKRTLYGTKYTGVYTLDITILNENFDEFTRQQTRDINAWLTGSQTYSWMNLYVGDEEKCRLFCYVRDVKPYKIDSRIVGFIITVESNSPWAYGPVVEETFSLIGYYDYPLRINVDERNKLIPINATFKRIPGRVIVFDKLNDVLCVRNKEIKYNDQIISFENIQVTYNENNQALSLSLDSPNKIDVLCINNYATKDYVEIKNIAENETINLTENMIIKSSKSNRIFGTDFNYEWPRIKWGINIIDFEGDGDLKISYTLPMKIGDCIYDLENET